MKKEKNQKLKKIQSSQMFSPIRDIKDGIIITKDGRFVKVMEFSPINFALRSNAEQDGIISQFTKALKGMPGKVQFKVVARRADVSDFVDGIREEMAVEENANCRTLQQEQIEFISAIGTEQGISRRFFVVFDYEVKAGLKRKPTFDQISAELHNQAFSIKNTMEACGNEELSINYDDEYTLSVLYSIMSRGESERRSFEDRELDVLAKYASVKENDYSKPLHIPVNDFIAPTAIDAKTSPKYIVIDGVYYSFFYLPSNAYPIRAVGGWFSLLTNMGEGVDVDLYIQKEDLASVQRKLQYKLRYNNVKMRETEDTSQDYDDLLSAIESGYYLKSGIARQDEFYYMATLLTVTAHSMEELELKTKEIKRYLTNHDMKIKSCLFQQLDAFNATLPLCAFDKGIFAKSKRNILTSSLASAYPFVSFEMSDENGILFGTNKSNNSLVFVDIFDTRKYSNANMAIVGSSGSGKTYLLQCMALRMREKHIQVFIIAPDKGHEFERACTAVGGQFITIAAGSGQNINIMEIRKKDDAKNKLIFGRNEENTSILAGKIQKLHAFFSLLIPDIKYEEKQILDEALIRTYNRFGITNKNKSLYDPLERDKYRKMPVLGDLHEELKKSGDDAKRLFNIMSRFVTGSAASFNAPTNVKLDNKYIVLDVSALTEELRPIGMFIALDYVWDKAREDLTAKKAIYIDETWKLVGPNSSVQAANFVLDIFKLIRGYSGAAIAATQDLNDFFAFEDGRFGKSILNNAKSKMILKTEPQEATRLAEAFKLTSAEIATITQMERGTGLLAANTNHIFIDIKASKTEHDLITTNRKDYERFAQ